MADGLGNIVPHVPSRRENFNNTTTIDVLGNKSRN